METCQQPSTTVCVDGFRSLKDFRVELRPGINALVGPNGAGKSNFIEFFDFLFTLLRGGLPLAVSRSGGIARVFSQEALKKRTPSLKIELCGVARVVLRRGQPPLSFVRYRFAMEIRFSKATAALYVKNETLKLGRLRASYEAAQKDRRYFGQIKIDRNNPRTEGPPHWNISPSLLTENKNNPLSLSERVSNARETIEEVTAKYFERFDYRDYDGDRSFLSEFPRAVFPVLDAVKTALTRGRSFNISPQQVRALDDLSRPPFIDRDGAGLSSTLYQLQSLKQGRPTAYAEPVSVGPETLDTIVEWTKLIYPQLIDISVQADLHSGKYLPTLTVKAAQSLRVPFQSASDGTLKWLALITLMMTSPNTYSLEEPENFLHPKMQQFLISLIRDVLDAGDPTAYFLISTHSETLINEFSPTEIIIFDFVDGRTHTRRVSDPDRVMAEINRTGFGLGHYYVSNALS